MSFFFFVAEIDQAIEVFVIGFNRIKVVFDDLTASVLFGGLVAEVRF